MEFSFEGLYANQSQAVFEICQEIGIEMSEHAPLRVCVERDSKFSLIRSGDMIRLTYNKDNELFRGLTMLGRVSMESPIYQKAKYEMLCYMVDNSRNAVLNIPSAKQMIRYLAMLGFDSMMLYTEDTYEIPEYKYFGHMKGRFTTEELIELDDYASSFGIELIPCIQTLSHLKSALRWPEFKEYRDTEDILLVGDERTYQFIDAALRQCKRCFRSKRIHIGMDEAVMIGRGKYLTQNGYRDPAEVMIEHLNRVAEMCRAYEYEPMMWGDLYFHIQYAKYPIKKGQLRDDVVARAPKDVSQVYWDYSTDDRAALDTMFENFARFAKPTIFAGGVSKEFGFGGHNRFAIRVTKTQLDACETWGCNNIIATGWGNESGQSSQFSAMATLIYYAERCYGKEPTEEELDRRAQECFDCDFDTLLAFDLSDSVPGALPEDNPKGRAVARTMLYNDPLERLFDRHLKPESAPAAFAENAKKLLALKENKRFGYVFESLGTLCNLLSRKCDLGIRLYEAYGSKDTGTLARIAEVEIPQIKRDLEKFVVLFRRQWYRENKTFGFNIQEIRLGGLIMRIESIKLRLESYLNGEISVIEELECPALPADITLDGEYVRWTTWHEIVSAGVL